MPGLERIVPWRTMRRPAWSVEGVRLVETAVGEIWMERALVEHLLELELGHQCLSI